MKNTIQKSVLSLIVVFITIGTALAQKTADATKMLKDEQRKEQIFSAILNDREMRAELMKRMMAEGDGSSMMMQHMMQATESDTATCNMMSSMMMKNPHMMDMMMSSMMDKAEGDNAVCKKMCMMMMGSDKMKGMMQEMKGQGQPTGTGKAKESSNMKAHLDYKHPKTNKNK
ncbi:hypothetical protein MKJ04_19895 [Pontibacter sp. E15-1]|uniref:hypothetical protein n=1 Tax=Pontibacter sp. E15-1 TaxID=2919918 RepID=UPI001F4FC8E8|nr:hypothetical protein [Pontibacter sp. E15-1]MCJ8167114.1 hypothetical protein [Pontibacter sp. E15-1]